MRFGPGGRNAPLALPQGSNGARTPSLADDESLLALAGVSAPFAPHQASCNPLGRAASRGGLVERRGFGAKLSRAVALACGLEPHQAREDVLLRQQPAVPEPYRLLASRQPVPLEQPRRAVAINAESVSPAGIAEIAGALGPAQDRLALVGRRALTAAIARVYGPQLAIRASHGLRQRNPRFSAATGLVRWQVAFLTITAGLFLGAVIFAPREALGVYSAVLSLMFLLTISLRVAAAVHRSTGAP